MPKNEYVQIFLGNRQTSAAVAGDQRVQIHYNTVQYGPTKSQMHHGNMNESLRYAVQSARCPLIVHFPAYEGLITARSTWHVRKL